MRRRDDADPAELCDPVALADGRSYLMPRPTLELVAQLGADGSVAVRYDAPGLPGYADLMQQASGATTDPEFYAALTRMALMLLGRVYDGITPDDVGRLFRFKSAGDELGARLFAHCMGRVAAKN